MGTITQAMASSATSLGVEIRTRAPVAEVIVENGAARGVRLASGEEIEARTVLCNADPKRTFTTLFRREDLDAETIKQVGMWKTQAGCAKFLAGLKELPDLSRWLGTGYDPKSILHMRIMPSLDYHQRSWDDSVDGRPTTCPIMGIQFPSVVEPGLVPRGGHVISIWVLYENPTLKDQTWDDAREEVGEQLIDAMTEYAPNFRESIVDWTLQTPIDIETRVGMTGGNIRHLDMIPSQMLSQRQPYRTGIKNFYMCGAGTHPSGEVTGAPGHNAAQAVLKDLAATA